VIYQPPFDSRHYSGINPYALGFNMMQDLRRICEHPTDEDRKWFPDIAGSNWLDTLHFAMANFKDESFVLQFLSPKLMRDFKLFSIRDDDLDPELEITAIHDEPGYRYLRESLSQQYNLSSNEPNIQIWNVDIRGDRSLHLRHVRHQRRPLEKESAIEVLKHLRHLWKFDVILESWEDDRLVETYRCRDDALDISEENDTD
jgi:spore cortex formation protein SpoVR/YcgB (stage V sporulation)